MWTANKFSSANRSKDRQSIEPTVTQRAGALGVLETAKPDKNNRKPKCLLPHCAAGAKRGKTQAVKSQFLLPVIGQNCGARF